MPLRTVSDSTPNFHGLWVDTVNNEIAVSDDNGHSIQFYARTATGTPAPLRTIQGLSTGIDFPSSVVVDTVNGTVWTVDDDTSDRAEAWPRTTNGNVAPTMIIDFKVLGIAEKRTYGWAVDPTNGEVLGTFQYGVVGTDNGAIYVFSSADGGILRSIAGSATTLADPHGLFDDAVNNEIVATNWGHVFDLPPQAPSVTVFARTANGNVAPLRTIAGSLTGLSSPNHVFVDTVNNEIAVANGVDANSITVFARTANGNVAPLRTIAGSLTGLNNPAGVYIDGVNNELVVANWGSRTVTVFSRTATGNVAPLRSFSASPAGAQVGIGNPGAVSADLTNNELGVANCVSHPRIAVFSRTANGQVAPLRVIQGQATRLSRSMHGIAIDPVNNEIVVPSTLENAVLVFPRTGSGNIAPLRVIQGSLTGINQPQGIAIDTVNNEIAVANEGNLTISIYSRTASGNVAPLRVISDATATMAKPVGIWIDNVNNEIVLGDGQEAGEVVQVYPRLANGSTTPLRQITGPTTMLSKTRQVMVDPVNNEVVVANQGDRSVNPPVFGNIAVYPRLANGDVAPLRFIQMVTNSFVEHPRAVWVDNVNNEIGGADSKLNRIYVFPRLF